MEQEEYQEYDIIFPEKDAVLLKHDVVANKIDSHLPKRKKKRKNNSVPIDIPRNNENANAKSPETEAESMVPPHLIVGRRVYARKMAFSVCSGNGRTLKGRDLSQVRNSILRMTGFLET